MPESSTGDGALPGSAADEVKPVGGTTGTESSDANSGVPPADSPTAEKQDAKPSPSLADAVRAALAGGKEQPSGSSEGEGSGDATDPPEGEKPPEGDEEDPGEFTEEELNSQKPKTQARIKKLLKQTETLTGKVTELEPQAAGFRAIQDYAKASNLSREDVNTGFEIMRMMRNEPAKALEALTPIFNQLRELVGEVLPQDMQSRVNTGAISLEDAKEISRLRAGHGITVATQKQTEERTAQDRQSEQARQSEQLKADVGSAITKWESDWKSADPDYSLKSNRVNAEIERVLLRETVLAQQGKPNKLPKTVAEAVKMADDVKRDVEKELRQFIPKRNTPINHVSGNGAMQGSKPVAKSVHDAVAQAVGHR